MERRREMFEVEGRTQREVGPWKWKAGKISYCKVDQQGMVWWLQKEHNIQSIY